MNNPRNPYRERVKKTKEAIWVKAFPKQAVKLRASKESKPAAQGTTGQPTGSLLVRSGKHSTGSSRPLSRRSGSSRPKSPASLYGRPPSVPKVRRPIAAVSKRNSRRRSLYTSVKLAMSRALEEAGIEWCPVAGTLWGRSLPISAFHHTRGRAGTLLYDSRYLLPISQEAHEFAHDCPDACSEIKIMHPLTGASIPLMSLQWNTPDQSYDDATNSYLFPR